jgi:DNA-binding SARP family transcriptional activator
VAADFVGGRSVTTTEARANALDLRVLGPIEVRWRGHTVDVGSTKSRALLARLVVARNHSVSSDRLLEDLWGGAANDSSEIALRSTVSRLRKRLRDGGLDRDIILTRPSGYSLEAADTEVDAARFERLVAEGRSALDGGHAVRAASLLADALECWRGAAFGEFAEEDFARSDARRLEELRLSATEARVDAELALGHHSELIGELETLTSAHPLRERLWGQRMLALYRAGRQAEALRVYQELRTTLVDELGIDPDPEVAQLEQDILAQRPDIAWSAGTGGTVPRAGSAPATIIVAGPIPPGRSPLSGEEMPFVGREAEIDRLHRWWSEAPGTGDALMVVVGESGVGKSRLVREMADRAAAEEAIVLWGRSDEEPLGPYQAFAGVIGQYLRNLAPAVVASMPQWRLAELSRLVPALREYVPTRTARELSDPQTDRFRFFEAVASTLMDAAAGQRVLVVLDDLHWADQPTLLLLRHVIRAVPLSGPQILGAFNDTEVSRRHPLRELLSDLRRERPAEQLALLGLDEPAVKELVAAAGAGDDEVATGLHRLTDGNPLLLHELLDEMATSVVGAAIADTAVPIEDLELPDAVKELVARRVSRLPDEIGTFLQIAAVAGTEFDAEVVAEVANMASDDALDALDLAVAARILREAPGAGEHYAFSHGLFRAALYGELLRSRRTRYHHAIATAMESTYAQSPDRHLNELAHHFAEGASPATADKAVEYALAAGNHALGLLAFEEAARHFAGALDVLDRMGSNSPTARCDALLALGEAQNKAGDTAANRTFDEAVALARANGDIERLARAALRSGPQFYVGAADPDPRLVRLLEEVRAALGPDPSVLLATVTARLALNMVYNGRRAEAVDVSADAVDMARRLGDSVALGYALNARLHTLWGIEFADERLAAGTALCALADESGDDLLALHGHLSLLREFLAPGDMDLVRAERDRFARRQGGPLHPVGRAYAINLEAMFAMLGGDVARGEELTTAAMNEAPGQDMMLAFYAIQLLWVWWQRDQFPPLEGAIRAMGDTAPSYGMVRATLALVCAERGGIGDALAELTELTEGDAPVLTYDETDGVAMAMASAAAELTGAHDEAITVYRHLEPYAGTAIVVRAPADAYFGPADYYLGLLGMALGDPVLAIDHFEAALALGERMGAVLHVAAAQAELARALVRSGDDGAVRARELARAAIERAAPQGLTRIVRRAQEVLDGVSR